MVGPKLGMADALATAIYADQAESFDWLTRFPGYSVVLFTTDGEVRWSPSLEGVIDLG